MPNKTVQDLIAMVTELHVTVATFKADMKTEVRWLRRGMIGIISSLVAFIIAVGAAHFAR